MKQDMEPTYQSVSNDEDAFLVQSGEVTETTQAENSSKKSFQFRLLVSAGLVAFCGVSATIYGRIMKPKCGSWSQQSAFRSRQPYTTLAPRASLVIPGKTIIIAEKDMFDTVVPAGEGFFDKGTEEVQSGDFDRLHAAAIEGVEGLQVWAEKALGRSVNRFVVPRPSMELPGKILVVKSARSLVMSDQLGLVHQVEDNRYLCHVPPEKCDITEIKVGVSQSDGRNLMEHKDETLYVACHNELECHVMNVADEIYG